VNRLSIGVHPWLCITLSCNASAIAWRMPVIRLRDVAPWVN
jgi:hypothetical protein